MAAVPNLLHQQLAPRRLERHLHFVISGETVRRAFGHRLSQGITGRLGDLPHDLIGRRQWRMHVRRDHVINRGGFKRHMPRQCVIQSAAEAVHVGMEVFPLALDFFRRDVIHGAPNVLLQVLSASAARTRPKSISFGSPSAL